MKKITLAIISAVASFASYGQLTTVVNVPNPNNAPGTTGLRAPNGTVGHTVQRGQYFISAADLAAVSPTITSFGFALTSGVNTAANGTLTVYLQHTGATSYTSGTTWNTTGMTTIYNGNYNLPVGPAPANVDLTLPSAFNYTGGALNIAYEYTASVTSATAAIYTAFAGSALGATGASSTTATTPTIGVTGFRPVFRFGSPNTFTNEVIVLGVKAAGKFPTTFASPQVITADIKNGSNTALNTIGVGLSVTGVNTFTNVQIIPTLAPGAVATVTFAPMTSTVFGLNTISVSVLPDQNNINNNVTLTQSVTCDYWAYNPPTGTYTSGVGFGAGSGLILSKFSTPVASTCIAVNIGLSTDVSSVGKSVYGVLVNSTGSIIAQTNTLTIAVANQGTKPTFVFTNPSSIMAGNDYYVGIAQTAVAGSTFYPLGAQTAPATPNNYYTAALTGSATTLLTSNLGYFAIEAAFTSTCGSVGISELNHSSLKVALYPNPTINGKTTITGLVGMNTITVYNMLGQTVLTLNTDKEEAMIDLANQPIGNYLVKIIDPDNTTKTIKVINQ
jgi:hypothetical protein